MQFQEITTLSNIDGKVIGVRRLIPIIDFNCIVDTEYGLIQLIYDQYYDLSVFNQKKFERPTNEILLDLYTRTKKNPAENGREMVTKQ